MYFVKLTCCIVTDGTLPRQTDMLSGILNDDLGPEKKFQLKPDCVLI